MKWHYIKLLESQFFIVSFKKDYALTQTFKLFRPATLLPIVLQSFGNSLESSDLLSLQVGFQGYDRTSKSFTTPS